MALSPITGERVFSCPIPVESLPIDNGLPVRHAKAQYAAMYW